MPSLTNLRSLLRLTCGLGFVALASALLAAPEWTEDFAAAEQQARAEGKPLLLDFTGSDWCIWCQRLDKEVLSQDAFQKFADDYILVKVDFPRKADAQTEAQKAQNRALLQRFGVEGFPTLVLVSPEGQVLARSGYRRGGADAYVKHLEGLLARANSESP